MSALPSALRDEALALPAGQRAELAAALLHSVDGESFDADSAEIDRVWGGEMLRRSAQIDTGGVKPLTWDEVLHEAASTRRPG